MTISSTVSRVDYTGNGSTSVYSFSFVIQKKEDIELTEKNTAGVETVLVQDTNYTVQLNDDGTGSITLLGGNLTTNHILSILRKVQIKQETDLRNQGEFFAETHESMADYAVMIDQQQQDEISRCIKNPTTTSNSSFEPTLPTTLAGNANRALVTNSSGNGFDVGPTTDQIQNAATSAANAATSATNAATSATNAATSESNAATSATNAATSETNASSSASTATSKAGEASTSASNAATSATNAATSATNASASASTATTKASEASTSATNAATSETNASASASTATTKAGEASTSASNAATSATNAATSATNAASSATAAQNAANNVIWNDVQFFTTSNSPLTVGNSHRGAMLAIDCSSGDFVVNLPQISNLDLSSPYVVAIKKTDNSGNKVTINRASTDTIDGNTSVIIQNPDTGYICIPDTDPNPDEWTTQIYGAVTGDNTVDTFTGDGSTTNFTLSVAPGNKNNVQVYINNQYQNQSDYSVSNTTLTFNSAPANSSTIECVTGTTVSIGVPADGSVTSQKLDTNIAVSGTFSASTLDISGNIRMPYSTSKYIIGPEQVASNTFRTTFDSIEINGADGLAGGSAMGGGSVIIRGGGAQGNSSTNSYGGHVKIYGGELLGGGTGAGQIYLYTNNIQRMIVDSSGLITGDFNDISDISLKKNVRDFEKTGLEIVKDIQPRLFDWREEEKGNNVFGFIAQELEKVMPTAVIQGEIKSINVTSIVSVLVASVQELTKRVEELEKQLKK